MWVKKPNLKDLAYQTIKQKIVDCVYLPQTFLDETTISKELNVSRTPIREALNRLEQENLVRIYPKRGVLVTDISIGEVNEIFSVRELLEPSIIRIFPQDQNYEQFLHIERCLLEPGTLNGESRYKIDEDIHSLIIKSSENRYFSALMENIYNQNHRLRIIAGEKIIKRLDQTNHEHLIIVQHLLRGDREQAAQAMCIHLQNSHQAAIEGLTAR